MKKNIRCFILLASFILFLSSCSNLNNSISKEYEMITISGTYGLNGAFPEQFSGSANARNAMPNGSDLSGLEYCLKAEQQGFSQINGQIDAANNFYSISIPASGVWTLTAYAVYNDKIVLQDIWKTQSLSKNDKIIAHNFKLKPFTSESGKGELNISLDISGVSSIVKGIKISSLDGKDFDVQSEFTENSIQVKSKNGGLTSGNYKVDISLYSSNIESEMIDQNIVFSCTQNINIFDNLTTNSWVSNKQESQNDAESYINNSGNFVVTDTVLDSYIQSVIYVDGNASEDGNGSWFKPYKKVQIAAEKLNQKSTGGNIYLKGTTYETSPIVVNNTMNIKKWGNGSAKIVRSNVNENKGAVIKIQSDGDLNISDITLDGAYSNLNSSNEAIIVNYGSLSLIDSVITNVKVEKSSTSSGNGGAIYNESGTNELIIDNTKINNCSAVNGGGIYNKTGTIKLTNGSVIGNSNATTSAKTQDWSNSADDAGGGVYNCTDGSLIISGDNTSISFNLVGSSGGGIYNQGTVSISSGKIAYNTAEGTNGSGGGVYNSSNATFTISGENINIAYNKATKDGGGIYTSGTVEFFGGNVHSNLSNAELSDVTKSQGIYDDGILKMQGSAKVSNNFIYLNSTATSSKSIKITGSLDANAGASITIPKSELKVGSPFYVLTGTSSSLVSSNYSKFAISFTGTNENAFINSRDYRLSDQGNLYFSDLDEDLLRLAIEDANNTIVDISSANDLSLISEYVSEGYDLNKVKIRLKDNITLNSENFIPIGNAINKKPFSGTFDGNNKTITFDSFEKIVDSSNISSSSKDNYFGLISYGKNAIIQNVRTEGSIKENYYYAGAAIVGYAEDCVIKNCNNAANITVQGTYYCGGVVGNIKDTTITRTTIIDGCRNSGTIDALNTNYVGGITGNAVGIIIRNCINTGIVKAKRCVGGIIGCTSGVGKDEFGDLIENCGNTGTITVIGTTSDSIGAGGIAGGPTATNSNWYPHINNCFSTGNIEGFLTAGIFGNIEAYVNRDLVVANSCYFTNCDNPIGGRSSYNGISKEAPSVDKLNTWVNKQSEKVYKTWVNKGGVPDFN